MFFQITRYKINVLTASHYRHNDLQFNIAPYFNTTLTTLILLINDMIKVYYRSPISCDWCSHFSSCVIKVFVRECTILK